MPAPLENMAPLEKIKGSIPPLLTPFRGGEVDYEALVGRRRPFPTRRPDGDFVLLRIGDAIQSRNVHAAIYDGLRYGLVL